MNTYDFDKTIFPTDSGFLFVCYCAKKYPQLFAGRKRNIFRSLIRYFTGKISTKQFKETAYSFLNDMNDVDAAVDDFWKANYHRIQPWYKAQKREDDVIISASPDFLLRPVAEKLGVTLIATRMDKKTGRIEGANCHDNEKVHRFYDMYPNGHSEYFFSDSLADTPMAEISAEAYLVKHGKLYPWP